MPSAKHEEKRCPRCGERFECKLNNPLHCGCADIDLGADALEALGRMYDDCLCPACLREIALRGRGHA
jgi:hypothetical protein